MVAIYGLIGDATRSDLEAMGSRLAHRGTLAAHWTPASGVWLGMQSRALGHLATDGPLLLDGALDNRWHLPRPRGSPSCQRLSRAPSSRRGPTVG